MTTSQHIYTAALDDGQPLLVTGGSLSLDDSRSPHVEGELHLAFPGQWADSLWDDPFAPGLGEDTYGDGTFGGKNVIRQWQTDEAALANIDPRTNVRVIFTANVTTDTYTHVRRFNLALRERDADHADGTVTLRLASDEALLDDWKAFTEDRRPLDLRHSVRAICNYVLNLVIPGAALTNITDADWSFTDTDYDLEALVIQPGQSAMDFLRPLVQAGGLRLVCDELRGWTLRDGSYVTGGSLPIEQGRNALTGSEKINRADDDWFDAAVTVYTWKDRDGVEQTRTDAFAMKTPYRRARTFEKDTPYPGRGFSSYAVRRAQRRGREGTASTVADWRAHAEMPVVLTLDGMPTQTGKTGRVEFDLDRDEMTVTTRTIDTRATAWLFLPAGQAWSDSPVGASWTEEEA
ncbi:hypothetical protein SAMN04487848_2049 [Microbacterium sp. ru370.1]|uniref:hypothetical protein n=1 Tax=unclassified Microbacterium TaxID=2609290 RepID=UPI000882ACF2|nr:MULTISPECIES: hypothetical protein [unclassified Microbacterium]SDO77547.1 hypothetical protein SAMN04487848_2049 [Microbacterium sp. ru370.1]SIT88890.1 hypothetical protein SAMN05880579_2044 [Microbacterium sp. RU1D]